MATVFARRPHHYVRRAAGTNSQIAALGRVAHQGTFIRHLTAPLVTVVLAVAAIGCRPDDAEDPEPAGATGAVPALSTPAVATVMVATQVEMPDLRGLWEEVAVAELDRLGFETITIDTVSPGEQGGFVIAQAPVPGTTVDAAVTSVTLRVNPNVV